MATMAGLVALGGVILLLLIVIAIIMVRRRKGPYMRTKQAHVELTEERSRNTEPASGPPARAPRHGRNKASVFTLE